MRDQDFLSRCEELTAAGTPYVQVTLVEATGSTPQDVGARMLVTAEGLAGGTVGGGRIEAKAIEQAQTALREKAEPTLVDWSLKADVGMTCGGRVKLFFQSFAVASWEVVVFGAGHVAQALTRLLITLPACRVTCIDPRSEWLAKLPEGVLTKETENPADEVGTLPEETFVLCMTRGHSSDLPVLKAIFETNRQFPFLGVIGSKAKATVLRKELLEAGISAERVQFHCPVGLPIGSNHPAEIAVSIVAQLLEVRDQLNHELHE
ncbi:MAG: xanthine dehydrogenase accessory protein XdhC [Lacipirellulaceae bacterium]